jgi:hypothetical protein
MKGRYAGALTWNIPQKFPEGRYNVYAWIRTDAPAGKKLTYKFGFYNTVTKKTQNTRAIPADDFSGKTYKRVWLSHFALSGGLQFFIGDFNGKHLPDDNKIWIHSLEIEPVPGK